MRRTILPVLVLLVLSITGAQAMTIHKAEVRHNNGRHHIHFDVTINAGQETVAHYMDDHATWPQWSSVVKQATLLDKTNANTSLLKLELYSCLFIFCRTLNKIEKVTRIAPGHLVTVTTGNNSDFRYAREIWKATAKGQQTRLVYDAVMEPAFSVPLFRNWIISSRIRKELKRSIAQLEKIAHTGEHE